MKRRWLIALTVALVVASAAGGAFILQREVPPAARDAASRPKPALALLTSLPLLFGDAFALDGGGSPTLTRLEARYRVVPVAVADAASLRGQRLLLMAHPARPARRRPCRARRWVRDGGRVVLLADPKLEWPSERALGDRLRPPPDFADTGLLAIGGCASPGRSSTGRGQASAMARRC